MAVSTTHKLYNKYLPQIELVRTILSGGDSIRANSLKYIPKPSGLDLEEYNAMINRPSFDNIVDRMLETFTGLIFSKEIIKEAPNKTLVQLKEMDLSDNTDTDISKNLLKELFITGRVGCLVDVNNTNLLEPISKAQLETMGIRPYISVYPSESIINWRMENNQYTLIVLREIQEVQLNKFEVDEVVVYRVLEIDEDGYYKQTIMSEVDNVDTIQSEIYPTQNGQRLKYIPFYVANAETLSIEPVKPPLWDMSDSNLSMHKLKIDFYHGLFYTIPTAFMVGVQEQEAPNIVLGSSQVHSFSNPNADMRYLEFTGGGLSHISSEINNCKLTMGSLGAEFLRDNSKKGEAVETVAMRNAGDRATLLSIANVVSRLMTKLIEEMARYNGEDDKNITYRLNTELDSQVVDEALIKVVSDNVQMNLVPKEVLFNLLQKADLIPENIESYEDFQNSLEVQEFDIGLPETKQEDTSIINSLRSKLGL